jgi:2-C-methyl-D-erythritol 4-phosphate cytidylyltransferase/2-C-methyl-D-erythritol 2,4-cyclodiphosphate synthase
VIVRSIEAFRGFPEIREVLAAVSLPDRSALAKTLSAYGIRAKIVRGGKTRAESVRNALRAADPKSEWIMVHDGARPLVSRKLIKALLVAARRGGSDGWIAAAKVVPTIKKAGPKGEIQATVDRSSLYEAQTPQLVRRRWFERSYRDNPEALSATDEASLLEAIGRPVKILAHEGWNPKITAVRDLELAEAYGSAGGGGMTRVGFGKDIHRLVSGRKFLLGGVRIKYDKGPLAHSDGDALLHALSDAILGATGAGDIGDWFSDRDPKNKNLNSEKILAAVLKEARRRHFELVHLDTVITLERPKLGPAKEKIRKRLAKLTGLGVEDVSVKAKTMEGLGPEGEGLAVSCEAVVTVRGGGAS